MKRGKKHIYLIYKLKEMWIGKNVLLHPMLEILKIEKFKIPLDTDFLPAGKHVNNVMVNTLTY